MPTISTEWRDLLCEQASYELNNERTYLKVALFWDALNYSGMVRKERDVCGPARPTGTSRRGGESNAVY